MVSDILADARAELVEYLTDPVTGHGYPTDPLYPRLLKLIDEMDEIQNSLDTSPGDVPCTLEELHRRMAQDGTPFFDRKLQQWVVPAKGEGPVFREVHLEDNGQPA